MVTQQEQITKYHQFMSSLNYLQFQRYSHSNLRFVSKILISVSKLVKKWNPLLWDHPGITILCCFPILIRGFPSCGSILFASCWRPRCQDTTYPEKTPKINKFAALRESFLNFTMSFLFLFFNFPSFEFRLLYYVLKNLIQVILQFGKM